MLNYIDSERIDKDHVFDIANQLKGILLKTGFDEAGSITKPIYTGISLLTDRCFLFVS
jgi:hypothetical protein